MRSEDLGLANFDDAVPVLEAGVIGAWRDFPDSKLANVERLENGGGFLSTTADLVPPGVVNFVRLIVAADAVAAAVDVRGLAVILEVLVTLMDDL